MKLPFFEERRDLRPDADPRWTTLVLVCEKCKGSRRGPDPRDVRKGLKHRLGKPKSVRIVEVHCFDICPDDGVSVCALEREKQQVELFVVDCEEQLDRVAATVSSWLPDR